MPEILVLTPERACDPSLAIAAVRAGALGLLDVGDTRDGARRAEAVRRLAAAAGERPWGLRVEGWPSLGIGDLEALRELPRPGCLLLAGLPEEASASRELVAAARESADRVLVEARTPEAIESAQSLGADGLVLKGNEAGGRSGEWSAFLLAQQAGARTRLPWWLQGALGPDAAAAARVAGAAGIVLREELFSCAESPLSERDRALVAEADATDAVVLGEGETGVRVLARGAATEIEQLERALDAAEPWPQALLDAWSEGDRPRPWGAGLALARTIGRHGSVAAALAAYRAACAESPALAASQRALDAGAPLAAEHGTTFPIVQGPMTRVSDVAAFADAVSQAGALPFLALALMRGDDVSRLLAQVRERLGSRPWGVGMLGFVPSALRQEQLQALLTEPPPFALLAGGHPLQAAELERRGVATYLHVPSPGLLRDFAAQGARRFVLEGRECGGHVGPRASLLLWQEAVDVLAELPDADLASVRVLFAGGIHDAASAAMAAALAARLVQRGARIGVLMGTAYLFTPEAVASGAIGLAFQEAAIQCRRTTLLESGLGHATRCAQTPFADEFQKRRAELRRAARPADEARVELELLNVGRLRLAAKGVTRAASPGGIGDDARTELISVNEDAQRRQGLFMLGQVASLRRSVVPMAELHDDVSRGSVAKLGECSSSLPVEPRTRHGRVAGGGMSGRVAPTAHGGTGGCPPSIAIVGMSCLFPDAADDREFWRNVVSGHDAVRDVPESRWSAALFQAESLPAQDRIRSKRGAFLQPLRFDPLRHRIPPTTIEHVEPAQFLALEAATRALSDAGLAGDALPRDRTAVIFGAGSMQDIGVAYAARTGTRHFLERVESLTPAERDRIAAGLREVLPDWTEDSFPGVLPNVIAGRIANRLDLHGTSYTIDAACASSLAAVSAAVEQLRSGACDVALAGAVDCSNHVLAFMGFSATHALTAGPHPRPFDERADGIVLGEGAGALVLMRLADAEAAGCRVRAVIRGVGSSSDGGTKGLTAPWPAGQELAIRRALQDAGVPGRSLSLVEAHATGTAVGDRAELRALRTVLEEEGTPAGRVAVGSIKSQIGHAKTAAGMAGLGKAILALEHRLLPPTIHLEKPLPELDPATGPLHPATSPRPWIAADGPRRAGVSAFGFGGTNFHVILEEHDDGCGGRRHEDFGARPVELFAWSRPDGPALARELDSLAARLGAAEHAPSLEQLAASVHHDERRRPAGAVRAAIVAASREDLVARLALASAAAREGRELKDPRGAWVSSAPPASPASVAFLFPGQGSQRPNMLAELVAAPVFGTRTFDDADRLLASELSRPLSSVVFPLPSTPKGVADAELSDTRFAQPAMGAADLFAHDVLRSFGLAPAFVAGHSYGEYVAVTLAGCTSREDLLLLSARRGRAVHDTCSAGLAGMLAVAAGEADVRQAIDDAGLAGSLHVANLNAPRQTIVAGPTGILQSGQAALSARGLAVRRVKVSAAFHTPLVADVSRRLEPQLAAIDMVPPRIGLWSNATATRYPSDPAGIRAVLAEHLTQPVRFVEEIRDMHAHGARVFLEAGPGRVLTALVERILDGEPHEAMALDEPAGSAWSSLARLLARCHALGLPVRLDAWHERRGLAGAGVAQALQDADRAGRGRPTDWWIEPGGSRPVVARPKPAARPAPAPAPPLAVVPAPAAPRPVSVSVAQDVKRMSSDGTNRPDAPPAASSNAFGEMQETMRQFLEHRRATDERFFALQERMLEVLAGQPAAAQAPAPAAAAPALRALRVAPAPVLPAIPATGAPAPAPAAATPLPASAPTPAPVAGAAAAAPAPGGPADAEEFRVALLAEVSRRTGYPEDVLDLDVPLEAGLGIDSIKTMEIFGALARYHAVIAAGDDEETVLANFTQLKTLRAILDMYAAKSRRLAAGEIALQSPAAPAPAQAPAPAAAGEIALQAPAAPAAARVAEDDDAVIVERRVVRAVRLAPPPVSDALDGARWEALRSRALVVVGGDELARDVLALVESTGARAVHVAPGAEPRKVADLRYEADLAAPGQADEIARQVRGAGKPGAVLVVLPRGARRGLPPDACSASAVAAEAARESLALLHLARAFGPDLEHAGEGQAAFVVLTAMDGRCGLSGAATIPLAHAGAPGFCKSLQREWRGVRVKCLDLEPSLDARTAVAALLAELGGDDDRVEVGLDSEGRWGVEAAETSDAEPAPARPALDEASVILALGGGRGVAAVALEELARRARPRLVIAGRTPWQAPRSADLPEMRACTDASEMRRAIIESRRAAGLPLDPASASAEVDAILRSRELHATLQRLRDAGSQVEYQETDVRDEAAVASLVAAVRERHGRLDGVVHAAGVVEDRLVKDKTAESFERVLGTKIRPALALASALPPGDRAFVAFFSSVSGLLGNAGQSDYAAANEILNRLALQMRRARQDAGGAPVLALAWGPWAGGMMSPALQAAYSERGVPLIGLRAGARAFADEIARGSSGEITLTASAALLARTNA